MSEAIWVNRGLETLSVFPTYAVGMLSVVSKSIWLIVDLKYSLHGQYLARLRCNFFSVGSRSLSAAPELGYFTV